MREFSVYLFVDGVVFVVVYFVILRTTILIGAVLVVIVW